MRSERYRSVPARWLPFLGRKLGLAKELLDMCVDPEDLDLHHVFPTTTSLGKLLGRRGEFAPRAGGAGVELPQAVDRAMGELLERYASLAYEGDDKVVTTHRALRQSGERIVAPRMLSLFTDEQLATPGFPYRAFTEDSPIGWIVGTNLLDGSLIRVPGQLVSLGYVSDPVEVPAYFYPTSSGCAAGPSAELAVLGGLLELIERDAVMIRWYARLAPPMLDMAPGDLLPLGCKSDRLEIRLHDLTVDGEVPVVGVTCVERTGRPCFFLLSAAAGVRLEDAARKALIEAGQGRPFIKVLANQAEQSPVFDNFDSNVRFFGDPANAKYVEWFFANPAVSPRRVGPMPGTAKPADLLRSLLDRCADMALTPIAFDLTTPDMEDHGFFACRVVVPELVPLGVPAAPFLGHPRLARFMAATAHERAAASVPDWVPHPFP
jgi:ribosomal protein S12 methylthiotransferase accessory factor